MSLRPDDGREWVTSGKRNKRVRIERKSVTQDDFGGNVETWAPLKTVMASWRRATAREVLASSEVAGAITDVFGLPWSTTISTITVLDRLIFDNRTYDIAEVGEIGFRAGMMIKATARSE